MKVPMNKEILKSKRLFLLDMDGTIYLDNDLFADVPEFLQYIHKKHRRQIYVFNQ